MALTTQERLFLERAALKLQANPALTPIEAMQSVCEDDQRIVETLIIMPDAKAREFRSALSGHVYDTIRRKKGL